MKLNFTFVVVFVMLAYTLALFFLLEWIMPTESHNVHSSMLPQEHHIMNTKHENVPPEPIKRSKILGMPMEYHGKQCLRKRTLPYDFDQHPILLAGPHYPWIYGDGFYNNIPCDVNCVVTRDWNENIYFRADGLLFHQKLPIHKSCPDLKTIYYTMENRIEFDWNEPEKRKHDLSLHSVGNPDVYASYFNYGLDLMKPPKAKTRKVLVSSYISNCIDVSSKRGDVIRELIKHGVEIDLYGKCFGKLNIPEPNMHIADPEQRKLENIADYKFHLVFENSQAQGYVSEKYWQALHAGTVPIVLGAPDIRKYEPRNNSILVVDEWKSIADLALEIKRIASNDEVYNQMLKYKTLGFSRSFLAAIQYTAPMYECRLCLKIADQLIPQIHKDAILIRESLTYYYRPLFLSEYTMYELKIEIMNVFKDYKPVWHEKRPKWNEKSLKIHRIVKSGANYQDLLWGDSINTDEKVRELLPGAHIEVIFV